MMPTLITARSPHESRRPKELVGIIRDSKRAAKVPWRYRQNCATRPGNAGVTFPLAKLALSLEVAAVLLGARAPSDTARVPGHPRGIRGCPRPQNVRYAAASRFG